MTRLRLGSVFLKDACGHRMENKEGRACMGEMTVGLVHESSDDEGESIAQW